MATKADLRRLVLTRLTVIDETENPSPEQASLLNLFVDGCRAELLQKGLCWWDDDVIPAEVALHLRNYVAAKCCGDFGKAGKGYEALGPAAIREIAALKSSEERETVPGDYS